VLTRNLTLPLALLLPLSLWVLVLRYGSVRGRLRDRGPWPDSGGRAGLRGCLLSLTLTLTLTLTRTLTLTLTLPLTLTLTLPLRPPLPPAP
jgi:hypothetical protein